MSEKEKFTPPETERKVTTFDDLMDHERVVPADYQKVREAGRSTHDERSASGYHLQASF